MAEKSWYWGGTTIGDAALAPPDGAPYNDDKFSDIFVALHNYDRRYDGVIFTNDPRYSGMFAMNKSGSSSFTINTGAAMIDGKVYIMDASQSFAVPNTGTYQIVLRKDFANQTVRLAFRAGSTVTQVDGLLWEVELYRITYTSGGTPTLYWVDYRRYLTSTGRYLLGRWQVGSVANGLNDPSINPIFNVNNAGQFRILRLEWEGATHTDPNSTRLGGVNLVINSDITSGHYHNISVAWQASFGLNSPFYSASESSQAYVGACGANGVLGHGNCEFVNWASSDNPKQIHGEGYSPGDYSAGVLGAGLGKGVAFWKNSNQINTIEIRPAMASLWTAGTFTLYGLQ